MGSSGKQSLLSTPVLSYCLYVLHMLKENLENRALMCVISFKMECSVADDEAFAEECRRRGQNALPFQPANARSPKSALKPAAYPKHTFHCNSDEDDDLVMTNWETPIYSSGYKEVSKRKKQKLREEQKKKKSAKAPY
ncbi:Hypothetical predicted protein [Podarcis lilfordi]|uniref:Uncharacterized protein n=1 Tax=Podarcis lilfordi TaxID=74358 RepID=A0AA35L395_9SAUR|nr:Hypothetical predicted protein [Podarcis lilfordi]